MTAPEFVRLAAIAFGAVVALGCLWIMRGLDEPRRDVRQARLWANLALALAAVSITWVNVLRLHEAILPPVLVAIASMCCGVKYVTVLLGSRKH